MGNHQPKKGACVGCSKSVPETPQDYTPISARFGWRLTRRAGDDGRYVAEWRCPECWSLFKGNKDTPSSGALKAAARSEPESGTRPSARPAGLAISAHGFPFRRRG